MKNILTTLKILISIACLYLTLAKIDFKSTGHFLYSHSGMIVLINGIVIAWLQMLFSSLRLTTLLKNTSVNLSFIEGFKITIIGSFFSQTVLSFLSGDALRVWYLQRTGIQLKTSANIIIIDRLTGLLALVILILCSLPFLLNLASIPNQLEILFSVFGGIVFALISLSVCIKKYSHRLKYQWLSDFIDLAKKIFLHSYQSFSGLFALSFMIHLCNIATIYLFMNCFQLPVSLMECSIIMIPVMLLMMMPISVGGWGIREGSMMIGFGLIGLPAEPVLAASIILGLSQLIAALPGALLFLFQRSLNLIKANHF